MSTHLDLEEQEQIDQLKHFWVQHGRWILVALTVVLAGFAAWNAYQFWQNKQAAQAAEMYDEIEKIVSTGDLEKTERLFVEMRDHFPRTTYTQQAGLLLAKNLYEKGKLEAAKSNLTWVAEKASDPAYSTLAKLRLSGLLLDQKLYADALSILSGVQLEEFLPMVADRRGDIYSMQGDLNNAKTEYQKAYDGFDIKSEYRRLIEIKLNMLGVNPKSRDAAVEKNLTENSK